jgi:hypothetical protein
MKLLIIHLSPTSHSDILSLTYATFTWGMEKILNYWLQVVSELNLCLIFSRTKLYFLLQFQSILNFLAEDDFY